MSLWERFTAVISRSSGSKQRPKKKRFEDNERAVVRKPQRMKDGFLWAEGMISARPCTIRDMSVLGARIELWHDDIKPSLLRGALKLYSCGDQQEVDCTLARRDGNMLGLRFSSALHEPSRKYG